MLVDDDDDDEQDRNQVWSCKIDCLSGADEDESTISAYLESGHTNPASLKSSVTDKQHPFFSVHFNRTKLH